VIVRGAGRPATRASDPATALRQATHHAGTRDLVVVTGSLYLVGAARSVLGLPPM
jgi:dihydrofolate synthase / folylpolyglutamate synthase